MGREIWYIIWNNIWATLSIVERFSMSKTKSSELWLVHNTEPPAEVYLNN
jgi:hypothetical protein